MKLATYDYGDGVGPGLVEGDRIRDLRSMARELADLFEWLPTIAEEAARVPSVPLRIEQLLAPVPQPRRFIGIGLNYRSHALETGREPGPVPTVFAKLSGALTRPYAEVRHPGGDVQLDYEGEIGLVIGRRCHRLLREQALEHVAGMVIVNDLTNRVLARPETLLLAKSCEGFAPMGPWLTTLDEVQAAADLMDPYVGQRRTSAGGMRCGHDPRFRRHPRFSDRKHRAGAGRCRHHRLPGRVGGRLLAAAMASARRPGPHRGHRTRRHQAAYLGITSSADCMTSAGQVRALR